MKKGDISDPVQIRRGLSHHPAARHARRQERAAFEEVKAELAKQYAEAERERAVQRQGRPADRCDLSGSVVARAGREGARPARCRRPRCSRAPAATASRRIRRCSRRRSPNAVLVEGNNSDPIELGPNHIVVVRIAEHEKPRRRSRSTQVRDDIRKKLVERSRQSRRRERADTLFARLQKGEALDKIAGELKLKVEAAEGHRPQCGERRSASSSTPCSSCRARRTARPSAGKSALGERHLRAGRSSTPSTTAIRRSSMRRRKRSRTQHACAGHAAATRVRGFVDSAAQECEDRRSPKIACNE